MAMTKGSGRSAVRSRLDLLLVWLRTAPRCESPLRICDQVAGKKWHLPHVLRTRKARVGSSTDLKQCPQVVRFAAHNKSYHPAELDSQICTGR
jgi:hypothetical protein